VSDRAIIESAARYFVAWLVEELRMRKIVRRSWAIIDGKRVPQADILFHDPGGLR
jgi:hypothetical protein